MQPELIQQGLMVLGIFLTSNLVAYTVYCIKGVNRENKIEIMSVRSELRKIDRLNKSDKETFF